MQKGMDNISNCVAPCMDSPRNRDEILARECILAAKRSSLESDETDLTTNNKKSENLSISANTATLLKRIISRGIKQSLSTRAIHVV